MSRLFVAIVHITKLYSFDPKVAETETNEKIFIRIRFDSTCFLKISNRFDSIRSKLYSVRFDSTVPPKLTIRNRFDSTRLIFDSIRFEFGFDVLQKIMIFLLSQSIYFTSYYVLTLTILHQELWSS
jgi:hypothetical protein